MGILDSNPADAGTVQQDSAASLEDKSVAELFAMEEEAEEANPKPVASEEPAKDAGEQAGEEPDGDKPDGEPDAEESDDQNASQDDKADSAAIEIDGKRYTRDEVKQGFMLQADYTRKTQEVAAERREMNSAVERLSKQDEKAKADLGFVQDVLNALLPPAPDPNTIGSDPVGYMQQKAQREQAELVLRELQSRRGQFQQQQAQQQSEQLRQALAAEWDSALKLMPELGTQEGKTKFRSEAVDFGQKHWGLTPQEIDGIDSSKALAVLRDAIAFRKLEANKPKALAAVKAAPKIAKPGTRENPASSPLARLQKLGSDPKASVADIFAAMEED